MTDVSTRPDSSADDLVPRRFDTATSPTPQPVRTVRGLLALPAMFVLWVIPKTVGPYLAAAGWRAAISAHVLSIGLGLGLFCWAQSPYRPFQWKTVQPGSVGSVPVETSLSWSEWVRGPLAALVIEARFGPTGALGNTEPLVLLAVLEGWLVFAAILMMPYHAAGERGRTLFGRCLRLSLWSSWIAIPIGIGWLIDPVVRPYLGLGWEWHPLDTALLSLAGLWWLIVLLRSGYRYAGPDLGPGWTPRTARCEGCGYMLAGLPKSTNCPECGRPVAESLPERRVAPAFATARGRWARITAFATTERELKRKRDFFSHLAIRRDHGRDRTFFLAYTCVLPVFFLVCIGLLAAGLWALEAPSDAAWWDEDTITFLSNTFTVSVSLFGVQIVLASLLALAIALIGRRDIRSSAIVSFYVLSTSLAPVIAVAMLSAVLVFILAASLDDLGVTGWRLWIPPAAVGMAGFVWILTIVTKRLRRACRETRFANA